MKYAIAYDITSDKRRTKVVKILLGYGYRIQKSVFEGFLEQQDVISLNDKLSKVINPKTDSVRFYALCGTCSGKIITIGTGVNIEQIDYKIF